ncbi:MAG: ABC transporter permease, partial [Mesorhizobium sp.]|nr:ABC transporter permease [Mesorhizobium sp.]
MSTPTADSTHRPIAPRLDGAALSWPWLIAGAAFVLFWRYGQPLAQWAFDYPRGWQVPAQRWISNAMKWLLDSASFGLFTFTDLTRFIARLIDLPYQLALSLLSTG